MQRNQSVSSQRNQTLVARQFKVILIGDSMVGKTSIIRRYIENLFQGSDGTQPTLAWDFKVKQIQLEQKKALGDDLAEQQTNIPEKIPENIKLYVWDTAGQERFRHIAKIYYKDVQGVLLVFDLTDEDSFKNISFWLNDLNKHAPEKIVKILVGNKVDLAQQFEAAGQVRREVSYENAYEFAVENQLYYYECSAKTGENVNEAFQKVADEINNIQKQQIDMTFANKGGSVLDSAMHFGNANNSTKKLTQPNFTSKQSMKGKCCEK